jgi:hypothetical protein
VVVYVVTYGVAEAVVVVVDVCCVTVMEVETRVEVVRDVDVDC